MEVNTNRKIKKIENFFIIFKLVRSILYFIPAIAILSLGLVLNGTLLLLGAGTNNPDSISGIIALLEISALPTIFCLVLLIVTIISTVKFFKRKYSKVLDIIITILFLSLDVVLLVFCIVLEFKFMGIVSFISLAIMVYNIIYIFCINKDNELY